jgi:hypothetical protein
MIMSISISAYFPEAELKESELGNAITRVAMGLAKLKSSIVQKTQPEIEIIFMLTGKYNSPGFAGMRMRRFKSQDRLLQFEAAVPVAMNDSAESANYIIAAMLDAAENASEFLTENRYLFDLESHMALIETLGEEAPVSH